MIVYDSLYPLLDDAEVVFYRYENKVIFRDEFVDDTCSEFYDLLLYLHFDDYEAYLAFKNNQYDRNKLVRLKKGDIVNYAICGFIQ
jgi:hypothetical protein